MIYRTRRVVTQEPTFNNDASSTSSKSDASVITEIRALRNELQKQRDADGELQTLREQLTDLQSKYDTLILQHEQQLKNEEPKTIELKIDPPPMEGSSVDKPEELQKERANSISKYFSELLTGPEDEFRTVFYNDKNDSNEYSIKQSELYGSYKGWCSRSGENAMKQSNAMSYISDGHIEGARCAKVKGDRVIKVNAAFVIPASDE